MGNRLKVHRTNISEGAVKIEIFVEHSLSPSVKGKLDHIVALLSTLTTGVTAMSGELDALKSQVQANTDAEQSAIILLNTLHQKLVDAIASGDPAQLLALRDQLGTSKEALAAAVVANTPAE